MPYRLIADLLVSLHLLFIAMVVFGGFLVLRWPKLAWLHVPVVIWGFLVELMGWICPLTPLEQKMRLAAGDGSYTGGFIEHYLMPLIYPGGMTVGMQMTLAALVLVINAAIYLRLWQKRRT